MNRAALPLLSVVLLALVAGGCSTASPPTPIEGAIALEKSFRLAVDVARTMPLAQRKAVAPAVNAGNAVLDELALAIGDGSTALPATTYAELAARLAPHLERVLRAKVEAEQAAARRKPPSTRPAQPRAPPLPARGVR